MNVLSILGLINEAYRASHLGRFVPRGGTVPQPSGRSRPRAGLNFTSRPMNASSNRHAEPRAKVLHALVPVEKPRGGPHDFAGVGVASGINRRPKRSFEF